MKYKYWLACTVEQLGSARLRRLYDTYRTAETLWQFDKQRWIKETGIREETAEYLTESRRNYAWEERCAQLEQQKIRLVTLEDEAYPKRLRNLPDAPYALFYKGRLPGEAPAAAVVGARACTEYGREIAGKTGELLAMSGADVISGMAKGVDSAGHYGALRGGGATYAVLGCGVDVCYPASGRALYQKLLVQGGIISEYPPQTPPLPMHFPMRNRIISGLSDAVAVIEAKRKSGSLITADMALEQGREVYAVPGRIDDVLSEGCNRLIEQGAGVLLSPEEFVKELLSLERNLGGSVKYHTKFSKNLLEKEEMLVYSVLDLHERNINEIIDRTGLEAAACMYALSGLLEKGMIREGCRNYYIRRL